MTDKKISIKWIEAILLILILLTLLVLGYVLDSGSALRTYGPKAEPGA